MKGQVEAARALLQLRAQVDFRNKEGITPLHRAVHGGHTALVRLLLDAGASVQSASKEGTTALHFAALNGYTEAAQLLLDRGAMHSAGRHKDGATPLHLAARNGHAGTIQVGAVWAQRSDASGAQSLVQSTSSPVAAGKIVT